MKKLCFLYCDIIHTAGPSSGSMNDTLPAPPVPLALFQAQLKNLRNFLDSQGGHTPKEKIVFIFEGGYKSHVTYAAPALKEYGFNAIFFIMPKRVGSNNHLSAEDIRALSAEGYIIGVMPRPEHADPEKISYKQLMPAWLEDRKLLEEITGKNVYAAALPGLTFTQKVVIATSEASFTEVYTTKPVTSNYRIANSIVHGSFAVSPKNTEEFLVNVLIDKNDCREGILAAWEVKQALKSPVATLVSSLKKWYKNMSK